MRLDSRDMPYVTVVIPTCDRPEALKSCLTALSVQSFDKELEVVVVDDGSQYDLNDLVADFDLNITLLKQSNKGPATARNNGVRKAKGEYIAFLDDDCEPSPNWLRTLYEHARPQLLVGGQTINKLGENRYSETSQILVSFLYEEWKATPWYFFTSNNFMVCRQDFLDIGGFDERFPTSAGEDREFCARFQAQGYNLHYVANAIVGHAHAMNFKSFWRQHFKYGSAAVRCRKLLHELSMTLPKVRLGFYLRMIKFSKHQDHLNFVQKLIVMWLLVVSQLATFAGYLGEGRSNG